MIKSHTVCTVQLTIYEAAFIAATSTAAVNAVRRADGYLPSTLSMNNDIDNNHILENSLLNVTLCVCMHCFHSFGFINMSCQTLQFNGRLGELVFVF